MATSTLEKIRAKAEEAKTKQAATGAGARTIRLDLIDFDPSQPRQDFYSPDGEIAPDVKEKLDELASSMKIHGQQAEVTVKEQGDGRYMIVVGERRVRAALSLGWEEIRANIRNDLQGVRLKLFRLAENVDRSDLSELDTAQYIAGIVSAGQMKKHELAAHFGKAPAWVTRYIAFADDANYQKWVKPGYIRKAWILYAVLQLPEDVQAQIYATCAGRENSELTSQELRRYEAMVKRGLPLAAPSSGDSAADAAPGQAPAYDPAVAAVRMLMTADTAESPDGYEPPTDLSPKDLERHSGKLRTMDNTPASGAGPTAGTAGEGGVSAAAEATSSGQASAAQSVVTAQLSVAQLSAILVGLQKRKAKVAGTMQSLSVGFRLPESVVRDVLAALGETEDVGELPAMVLGLKLAEAGHKLASK